MPRRHASRGRARALARLRFSPAVLRTTKVLMLEVHEALSHWFAEATIGPPRFGQMRRA